MMSVFYKFTKSGIYDHTFIHRAVWAAGSGDSVEAWRTQMVVVQAVARFMQEYKEENWMLPTMYTACLDLRYISLKCIPLYPLEFKFRYGIY